MTIREILREYRDVPLRVLVMLSVVYILIKIYKLSNPYAFPYIEKRFGYILIVLGVITALLYIPYNKLLKAVESAIRKIANVEVGIATKAEKVLNIFENISASVISLSLGQKFVLVAIVFLISAAFVLSGDETEASRMAILAYYFLLLGVSNLIVEYIMNPNEENSDPRPILRAFLSLIALSILIYYTREITREYPHLYLIPLVLSFLIIIINKIKK